MAQQDNKEKRLTRRERKFDMTSSSNTKADVEILTDLNANYLRSDQSGDVKWYAEHLADDFTATLPDLKFRNKKNSWR